MRDSGRELPARATAGSSLPTRSTNRIAAPAINAKFKRSWQSSSNELYRAEWSALRRLPLWLPEVYQLHQRVIDLEGYIHVDGHIYCVPYQLIGKAVEVRETKDQIRMFVGPRDCGAPLPRRGGRVDVEERCMRCERERSADALCALALGTYVTVRSEPGEIIGHAAGTAVVRLRDSDRHVRVRPEALTTSHHQPMIDERLPEHDCLAFGVSENEAELFSSWVVDRLGLVFCSQGPLGSGVFVSTAQGRTCLLTAAHVLDEALKTGTIAVAACTAEPTPEGRRPARSPAIEYARRSRVAHAALLVMPRGFAGPGVLSFDDWRPDRDVLPSSSEALVSAGAPSDYVGDLNVAAKVLERLKVELLWSRSVGVNRATSELQIRASKYLTGVTSFEGMSGGPVFSVQSRRLLGINASEQGGFFEGIVNVTSRGSWMDFADEDA